MRASCSGHRPICYHAVSSTQLWPILKEKAVKSSFTQSIVLIALFSGVLSAQSGPERRDGYIPMLWDAEQGRLLFELTRFDQDILYFTSVAKGSGSGSVGLEWAGGGEGGVIQFQRVGPKVMVVQKNLRFRAGTGGPGIAKGIDASFPDSIIASLPVIRTEAGKVIVDATPLVVRDSAGFAAASAGGGRGGGRGPQAVELIAGTTWRFDPARSAIYLPHTKGFPKNSEVEVTATYEAVTGGARTAPESRVLTGRLHYSFVEPPTGYKPRKTDPRTGEILAARVRLESDRVRTVSRYWQTYEPQTARGGGGDDDGFLDAGLPPYSTPETEQQLVLLRQALLTAHETGHTLGFDHNWNSSMNDRASVMEYPSPRLKVVNGKIDLTDAYQKQIGAYDIMTVRYAYTEFPPAQEQAGLENIIKDMRKAGLLFTPSTDPRWNRYDDGPDPAEYLRQAAAQRKILLANYGPGVLRDGEPLGDLRGIRLWMTYLHHRWSIDSGVRYIGGLYTNFAVKGESIPATEIVPAAKQREILGLLLDDVDPASLAIPEPLLASLTVAVDRSVSGGRGGGARGPDQENMESSTGAAFDHLAAARTIAGLVFDQIFEPETAARLIGFADRQQNALTLPEMIDACAKKVFGSPAPAGMLRSMQRQTQRVFLDAVMTLGASPNATPDVKAVVMASLANIRTTVAGLKDADPVNEASLRQMERDLTRYAQNPMAPKKSSGTPPIMAPI